MSFNNKNSNRENFSDNRVGGRGLVAGGPYQKNDNFNTKNADNISRPRTGTAAGIITAGASKGNYRNDVRGMGNEGAGAYPVNERGLRRVLNSRTLLSLPHRVKPLPPDANRDALPGCTLFQLQDHVSFTCVRCKRANIQSDVLAADISDGNNSNIMLCTRCFAKIIRPKTFRPTRLMPFPSLLSWLNYRPPQPLAPSSGGDEAMPTDVLERPTEAVVPSGYRVAGVNSLQYGYGGSYSAGVKALPDVPAATSIDLAKALGDGGNLPSLFDFNGNSNGGDNNFNESNYDDAPPIEEETHPCLRVWGSCKHGGLCIFKEAPYTLAIEYLMGIATEEQCLGENQLRIEHVFNLPHRSDPRPKSVSSVDAFEGFKKASDDKCPSVNTNKHNRSSSALFHWVQRRKLSNNRAEWQLFNNGPLDQLLRKYVPIVTQHVRDTERGHKEGSGDNEATDSVAPNVDINSIKNILDDL